jgi:uncharacterized SAM-binding protein YcdF (DUF218 family)
MNPEIKRAAELLWDYAHVGHRLEPADFIFVLGSHDLRVAGYAADLFYRGLAPRVVLSGGLGRLTDTMWTRPEAEVFAEVLRGRGVPDSALLLETRATNTGENIRYTRQLLAERGLAVRSAIVVQKPYMERRAFAALRQQWPELAISVTSPPGDFGSYPTPAILADEVVHIMVGDFQRIMEYPRMGFAIPQAIPAQVLNAYELLVRAGYTGHLLADTPKP